MPASTKNFSRAGIAANSGVLPTATFPKLSARKLCIPLPFILKPLLSVVPIKLVAAVPVFPVVDHESVVVALLLNIVQSACEIKPPVTPDAEAKGMFRVCADPADFQAGYVPAVPGVAKV